MFKDRADILIEVTAILAMFYLGSAVLGRAMRTETYGKIEQLPLVGPVALGIKAVRKEAVS